MSEKEKELKDQACNCEDENCDCEVDTITLELEDGTSEDFIILDTVEHKGKNYIALAPQEGEEYFIYGFKEEGENVEFFSVDDDKEFDEVGKIFEDRFAAEDEEE
jgi:uncharacterized protein YrzB (UPF0473 family)